MRRMWIGIGLLALVLMGSIWASEWMGNVHDGMARDLERAAELAMAKEPSLQ